MGTITMGEMLGVAITALLTLVACVAWLIRLESGMKQCQKDIIEKNEAFSEALKEGDNRMNKIEDKIGDTLRNIHVEIRHIADSVNDKFTSTSNAVAELKGILRGREDNVK